MRGRRAAIAAFVAALSAPMVASAGESESRAYVLPAPAYDWTVTLGAEGREEPLFQGSSRERLRPYPIFAVRRYGTPEPFRGPRDGLDIGLIDGGNYQIGPVGQFVWSQRDKASSEAVHRLGNVPAAGLQWSPRDRLRHHDGCRRSGDPSMDVVGWSAAHARNHARAQSVFRHHHGAVGPIGPADIRCQGRPSLLRGGHAGALPVDTAVGDARFCRVRTAQRRRLRLADCDPAGLPRPSDNWLWGDALVRHQNALVAGNS